MGQLYSTRLPTMTATLTASVRRALFLPSTGGPVSDQDILDVGNEIVRTHLWPIMRGERLLSSWYDLRLRKTVLTSDELVEPEGYPIPPHAAVQLDYVEYFNRKGEHWKLTRRSERNADYYLATAGTREPVYYEVVGGRVRIYPHPASQFIGNGEKIRIHMQANPLEMAIYGSPVLYARIDLDPYEDSGSQVYRIESGDGSIIGNDWGTSPLLYDLTILSRVPPNVPVDFIDKNFARDGSASFQALVVDSLNYDIGDQASGTVSAPGRAGDLVVADHKIPFLQVPDEAYKVLVDGIVMDIADTLGKAGQYDRRKTSFELGLAMLPGKIKPRVLDDRKTFINRDNATRLRLGGRVGGRGRRGVDA